MITPPKTKKVTYWTVIGLERMVRLETLDECVKRVFGIDDMDLTRKQNIVYARHLKRHILERTGLDGKLTDLVRISGTSADSRLFKYSLSQIAEICNCDHATVIHSSKTAKNLIDTNKDYKAKADEVLRKIELNLIIFPNI
jgi:hypothetical protein